MVCIVEVRLKIKRTKSNFHLKALKFGSMKEIRYTVRSQHIHVQVASIPESTLYFLPPTKTTPEIKRAQFAANHSGGIYSISSIKPRLVINARLSIHTGWLHNCTKIKPRSPIYAGVMQERHGKHSKWPHACRGIL